MKKKKGIALLLCAVLVMSAGISVLLAASKNWSGAKLGDLSQYYETGNNADPGMISTVAGDSGGTSYGIYMFASNAGTPLQFVKWLKTFDSSTVYYSIGDLLYTAYAYNSAGEYSPGYGSNFNATWREIADTYEKEFLQAQKDYWEANPYAALLDKLESAYPAFDVSDYSIALQNVLWSRSVQHGAAGAATVVSKAFSALGGFHLQSEATLIQAIYAECSRLDKTAQSKTMSGTTAEKYGVAGRSMAYYSANSGDVQMSVYRRLHINEPADALVMLYKNAEATVPDGVYRLQRSGEANQLLSVSENGAVSLSSGTDLIITHYTGETYTLSTADGKRLSEVSGKVKMAEAAAKDSQLWQITGENKLKNCGTGRYLAVVDGALCTAEAEAEATVWPRIAQKTVTGLGLYYPGCEAGVTNRLVAGASSFPVRGVITCAVPITNVTIQVSGPKSFTAKAAPNANYYDLWGLDDYCTFSTLTEGDYTLRITATAGGETATLGESTFTVEKNTENIQDDETYTVTFIDGENKLERTYQLGDTYGKLPTSETPGFTGWFLSDGTEISANTMVAAGNHTVTAKYGTLYTVKFMSGIKTLRTLKLASGEAITAPDNPIKAATASYTYSFDCWQDADGNKYVPGQTYMGEKDITYKAQFTKTANGGTGGGTGGTGSAADGYLTGISPGTSVSVLTEGGYTVYSGSTQVTSGTVATGMTAKSGSTAVTIVVTGDTSGDGKITITDVVQLQKYVTGYNNLSGASLKAGDISGDGKVTITDVVQAAQVTVGQRTIR